MIKRYEAYNANIEPRTDGRIVFFADHEQAMKEAMKKESDRERQALVPIIDEQAEQIAVLKAENEEMKAILQEQADIVTGMPAITCRNGKTHNRYDDCLYCENTRQAEEIAALKAKIKSHEETESDTISRQTKEIERLKERLEDAINAVSSLRKGSVGSIDNVFTGNISVERVNQWRDALKQPNTTRGIYQKFYDEIDRQEQKITWQTKEIERYRRLLKELVECHFEVNCSRCKLKPCADGNSPGSRARDALNQEEVKHETLGM